MTIITNTPRAGESAEQTAARSAPRNVNPAPHKAKLAFLMQDDKPLHFYQLEDGRMLIIEITNGQLAGFVADGAKRLAKCANEILR